MHDVLTCPPAIMRAIQFRCWNVVAFIWCITMILNHRICARSLLLSNETDKLALLAMKARIIEDPTEVMSSWNESVHFCNWRGVSCGSRHQRIVELNLSSHGLKGQISSSIGNLSFLRVLNLSENGFQGNVPREIGRLIRLRELDLEGNFLGGQIPATLSNCLNLAIIVLSSNNFTGHVPLELGSLSKLMTLDLKKNNLEGSIPPHLGNLSSLQALYLSTNRFKGDVPASLGQLKRLAFLNLGQNMLSGMIPKSIYNLSYLRTLSLSSNQFQGTLPRNLGLTLPNIEIFLVWGNQFGGRIPLSISNASKLSIFDISMNNFFGGVPVTIFGNLKKLTWLSLIETDLGSAKANDLKFITSLTNCSSLRHLYLDNSNFGGELPDSVGNLSTQIESLSLAFNPISGNIPPGIGNLVSLTSLAMYMNQLTGTIPATIGNLYSLHEVGFGKNKLSGEIPSSIGNLTSLNQLWLEENNFEGSIPSSLGNCKNLLLLHLYGNALNGTIPPEVIGLSSLAKSLRLARNHLTGALPSEVGKLINLVELDVSENKLSGTIPASLEACILLERFYADHNMFDGTIPKSLLSLKGVEVIDLSHNNFSGNIPKELAKLAFLSKLNLSFNELEGEVPIGGAFSNVSQISIAGNNKLCGGIPELRLPKCSKKEERRQNQALRRKLIISGVSVLVGVCLLLSLLIIWRHRKGTVQRKASESLRNRHMNISYGELVQATDGFSENNFIGSGSFGSVYKGILETNQTSVAVKVLNLEKRGASKSFMTECETLRNIRHRNLVKIITVCSSVDFRGNDFKALIYEFMRNGSLESWLHPTNQQSNDEQMKSLTLKQKLSVAIDVASALDYLHNQTGMPIIHCDLKPSNILLDHGMTAHVGDFGLSRILAADNDQTSENQSSSVGIKGTIGYAAPEYGMGSKVSTEGDVYSFGILLLEMFTRKRPTDGDLNDAMNLNQFAKKILAEGVPLEEIVHGFIKREESEVASTSNNNCAQTKGGNTHECLFSIISIGIKCSEESPKYRMNINDALRELLAVKNVQLQD